MITILIPSPKFILQLLNHKRFHIHLNRPNDPLDLRIMELKDLSANWKKLQQTLKGDTRSLETRKRKAESYDLQSQKSTMKRRPSVPNGQAKETDVNGKKQTKDNLTGTGEVRNASTSLAAWAEENDIPAADIALAYGVDTKGTTVHVSAPERINEGLSPT